MYRRLWGVFRLSEPFLYVTVASLPMSWRRTVHIVLCIYRVSISPQAIIAYTVLYNRNVGVFRCPVWFIPFHFIGENRGAKMGKTRSLRGTLDLLTDPRPGVEVEVYTSN